MCGGMHRSRSAAPARRRTRQPTMLRAQPECGLGGGAWRLASRARGFEARVRPAWLQPADPSTILRSGGFGGGLPPYLRACPLLSPFAEPRPFAEEKGPSPGRGGGPGPADVSAHRGHRFLATALGSISDAFPGFPSPVWEWRAIRSAPALADLSPHVYSGAATGLEKGLRDGRGGRGVEAQGTTLRAENCPLFHRAGRRQKGLRSVVGVVGPFLQLSRGSLNPDQLRPPCFIRQDLLTVSPDTWSNPQLSPSGFESGCALQFPVFR